MSEEIWMGMTSVDDTKVLKKYAKKQKRQEKRR